MRRAAIALALALTVGGVQGAADEPAVPSRPGSSNPAALGFESGWEVELALAAGAGVDGDLLAEVDELHDLLAEQSLAEIQHRLEDGSATNALLDYVVDLFLYELPDIGAPGQGAESGIRGSLAFRRGRWQVSVASYGNGGLAPLLDLEQGLSLGSGGFILAIPFPASAACGGDPVCLDLADRMIGVSGGELDQARAEQLIAAADPARLTADPRALSILESIVRATADPTATNLAANGSGATIRGLAAKEVAFAYAYRPVRRLSVGARLALIDGRTFRRHFGLDDLLDGDGLLDAIDRRGETVGTFAPAIDVGLQWRLGRQVALGLNGRRLNRPEFEVAGGSEPIVLPARYLLEISGRPAQWMTVRADVDLVETESAYLPDATIRQANLALAFRPARPLDLWIGAADNLAQSLEGRSWAGGVDLRASRWTVSLAASLADTRFRIESATFGGEEREARRRASVALALKWSSAR